MSRLLDAWNRFWFATASSYRLSLLRRFLGLWVICKYIGLYGIYKAHHLRVTLPDFTSRRQYAMARGRFPAPLDGLEWLSHQPYWLSHGLQVTVFVGAVGMAVGILPRLSAIVTAVAWAGWFLASQNHYSHHGFLLLWMLTIVALSPCGDHVGLQPWLRKRRGWTPPDRPVTGVRAIQVLLTVTYASAAYGKLGPEWTSGQMIGLLHGRGWTKAPWADDLLALIGSELPTWGTLVVEGAWPLLIWFPATRWLAMVSGVAMHATIDALMAVTIFSYMMTSAYLVFLDPGPRATVVRWDPAKPTHRVLRGLGLALDWLGRLDWQRSGGPLTVTPKGGRDHAGVSALVQLTIRLPLLFPLVYVLGAPWHLRRPFWRRSPEPAAR